MQYYTLDTAIELLEQSIETLYHWDGRNLTKDDLEDLIGATDWDMRTTLDLLKQLKKDLGS